MQTVFAHREDEILMNLVHYFVTKENYTPMIVQGANNEIWLENVNGPYRVIRINGNSIINNEQFNYDQIKIKSILRQIKKKTFSFNVNALNINLNEDSNVSSESLKGIDSIAITNISDMSQNNEINKIFPSMKSMLNDKVTDAIVAFNIANDINNKTASANKIYEKVFSQKKIIVTYILMAICVIMYFVSALLDGSKLTPSNYSLVILGANVRELLQYGQIYRLITYAFLHGNLTHLIVNMYSLYAIGPTLESKLGKIRFLIIYLVSAIVGGMLSAGFSNYISIGASGAIFGLMGSLVYFGLCYRLLLKDALVKRIIPVILANLALGFLSTGVDNACHIGGLIGGFLITMSLGVPGAGKKSDRVNGIILLIIFVLFNIYLIYFR